MATMAARHGSPHVFGRESNGTVMTPEEFDRAEVDELWDYELVRGLFIVLPIPDDPAAEMRGELTYWVRSYRDEHPNGHHLSGSLGGWLFRVGDDRRHADCVFWCGLGRRPRRHEPPTIVVDILSSNRFIGVRDQERKRDAYRATGIREYWVIDRFRRCMTVFDLSPEVPRKRVIREGKAYKTNLLPGFDLPLARLFALADRWPADSGDDD